MVKKIVAINASPRRGWNTDMLIDKAIDGAEAEGAEVQKFDLYKLDRFTGCVSCFGCKNKAHEGVCIVKDGLKPVLDAIRESDGLIVGAPNYFSDLCAEFKLFYERLLFPYLTYNTNRISCNEHRIPVLLIMTCNAPGQLYEGLVDNYKNNKKLNAVATVTIKGKGNYAGKNATATFTIKDPKTDVEDLVSGKIKKIELAEKSFVYNGKYQYPTKITVTMKDKTEFVYEVDEDGEITKTNDVSGNVALNEYDALFRVKPH